VVVVPRRARADAWLWLGGAFQWGGTPGWSSGSGSIGAELVLRSRVTLHLDATFAAGALTVDVGRIDALQPSGALGLRVGGGVRWFRIEGGLLLRAGAVIWSGHSRAAGVNGQSGAAPFVGPAVDLVLSADLSRRLRLRLNMEVGVPALSASAEGDGTSYARLDPVWVMTGLELAVRVSR
jgi:hypothetical protein